MKINELMEAMPGLDRGSQKKALVWRSQQIKTNVDTGIKAWLYKVKELSAAGKLRPDSSVKDYVTEFLMFVASKARIPPNDPVLLKIGQDLIARMETGFGNRIATSKYLRDAMTQIVTANIEGKFGGANAQPASPAPAAASPAAPQRKPIKTGAQRKASDGQMYKLVRLRDKSREWHDLGGNRASDKIQKELGSKYGI